MKLIKEISAFQKFDDVLLNLIALKSILSVIHVRF